MDDKIDRIFVSRECPDCATVRAELDMGAVMEDDFRGSSGQRLHVFSALSDEAARELLDAFGHKDFFMPLLVPHEGKTLEKVGNITRYIRENGMAVSS